MNGTVVTMGLLLPVKRGVLHPSVIQMARMYYGVGLGIRGLSMHVCLSVMIEVLVLKTQALVDGWLRILSSSKRFLGGAVERSSFSVFFLRFRVLDV